MTQQQATQRVQQSTSPSRQKVTAPTRNVVASARSVAFALLADRALSA
jgi:hypothetical protein